MMPWHKQSIFLFFSLLFHLSCDTSSGDGQITGVLHIPACGIANENFHFELDAFAADYFDNTLAIRIQTSGRAPTFSDGLFIVIRDAQAMATSPAGMEHVIELTPELDVFKSKGPDAGYPTTASTSPARVTFYLNDTCLENRLAFTDGGGILQLDHVYVPGKSRRIKGSFRLEFIDPRQWNSPEDPGSHAEIEGDFDFKYNPRKTAQTFP